MTTIPGLLSAAARKWRDKPALVDKQTIISFSRLDAEADRVARGFLALGAAKGDRIALWAPNMWEWVAAAAGLQRIGCVLVPLNTRLRGPEVADILRRAEVRFLISIGRFLDRYYPDMLGEQELPHLERVIVFAAQSDLQSRREETWTAFLACGEGVASELLELRAADVSEHDIADIMFTSGTTGAPKGAVFDHRRSILGGKAWCWVASLTENDRYSVFGPFSHNASYKAGWVSGLLSGAAVFWPDAFDAESVYRLIDRHRITVMPAPPTVFQTMHAHPAFPNWDFSSLRLVSTGGTTIPASMFRKLYDDFKIPAVVLGYGMTECCGSATSTVPGDSIAMLASTDGRPVPGVEIRVVDESGHDVPPGTPGEVLIRCEQLLIEYLDDPSATAAAINAEGWLHSGDIGTLNAEGYLKITDRLKDMYITGGFNVYPAEIERQLSSLPGVLDCAVVGVPDERLGEVGRAFVVRAPGATISEADIIAWARENLANYKAPRSVTFLDSLPRNASGKVLKFELRKSA